ncbi:MAG: hypothetical protein NXI22_22120 [bacterium]|nr:hypothetical protein [bacterium]
MTKQMIQADDCSGIRLAVVFEQQSDRWSHQVLCLRDDESKPALVSLVGSPDQNWPPSPAVQQFSSEDRESGRVALLVGMAGKSFWSMSVHAEGGDLVFDVGCRHQIQPENLGSQYKPHTTDCEIQPDGDASLPISATHVDAGAEVIAVTPTTEETPANGMTRWKYRITFAD